MARHGGFAAVATVTESTVNDAVASYAAGLGPLLFPPPTIIHVGSTYVGISGIMRMLPPKIDLHINPNNLVTAHFAFGSTLTAQISGGFPKTWKIILSGTVSVSLITTIQNGRIVVGIDTKQIVFQPFGVKVIQGSFIPTLILQALQSKAMADTATAFVRSLPPFLISPPILRSNIHYMTPETVGLGPKVKVDLSATRIVFRVLDKAITVAVDLAGTADEISNTFNQGVTPISGTFGNVNELVDLTKVSGSGSTYVYSPLDEESLHNTGLILTKQPEPNDGNIATAINMNFISRIISKISDEIFLTGPNYKGQGGGMYITNNIRLLSVSLGHVPFITNWGDVQDGLNVQFEVEVEQGPWFSVSGRFVLQAFTYGPAPNVTIHDEYGEEYTIHSDTVPGKLWSIGVAKVEIDKPDWIDFVIAVAGISFSIAYPFLAVFIAAMAIDLMYATIPDIISEAEVQVYQNLGGANLVTFPEEALGPLPGLTKPQWRASIKYLSFTPESIDLAIETLPDQNPEPPAIIPPQEWSVYDKSPIPVTLTLRDDMKKVANKLRLFWTVRRVDTNEVVVSASKAYNDPSGNGVLIPHHTQLLYTVNAFEVTCKITISLGNQVGEIWSGGQTIFISDPLDRSHKYVQWGPYYVRFRSPADEWWTHIRRSRIHRTAVSARCKMLKERAYSLGIGPVDSWGIPTEIPVKYMDSLPFGSDDLNKHRKVLCEYCFFGGAEKVAPLPLNDWF